MRRPRRRTRSTPMPSTTSGRSIISARNTARPCAITGRLCRSAKPCPRFCATPGFRRRGRPRPRKSPEGAPGDRAEFAKTYGALIHLTSPRPRSSRNGSCQSASVTIHFDMATRPIPRILSVTAMVFFCGAISPQPALASPSGHPGAARVQANGSPAQIFLIFPFENPGRTTRLDWLGEGLEELTIERLASVGQQLFTHEERQAALEKSGLPMSTRFSRATMLRIAEDMDADFVIFGRYAYDGKKLKITANLLRVSPPGLVPAIQESGSLEELMDMHQRLTWRLLRAAAPAYKHSEQEFAKMQRPLRLDAFVHYIRGVLVGADEQRILRLPQAARLASGWADPAYALGQSYFARRDCDDALAWVSEVPPTDARG